MCLLQLVVRKIRGCIDNPGFSSGSRKKSSALSKQQHKEGCLYLNQWDSKWGGSGNYLTGGKKDALWLIASVLLFYWPVQLMSRTSCFSTLASFGVILLPTFCLYFLLLFLHESADDLRNTLFTSFIGRSCCDICLRGAGCESNGRPICLL